MGYLITTGILKKTVIVPLADVLTLDTIPYQIIPFSNENNYTILAANLKIESVVGNQITSFGHFYLEYKPSTSKFATYDENIKPIDVDIRANFLINMSHPPNQFGSFTPKVIFPLNILSELPPAANCDLIVTVYYFNNF
jgi:hypothetical protein